MSRNPRESDPTRRILAVAAVLLLLVAAYVATGSSVKDPKNPFKENPFTGGNGSSLGTEVPSSEGSTLLETPRTETEKKVTLLMDGWSVKTAESAGLSYSANDGRPSDLEPVKKTPLRLTPVDASDIGAIAEKAPDILTAVTGRMLTVDPRLKCDKEGCRVGDDAVDLSYLLDASRAPVFGESYKGYGIKAGLYKADIYVPSETSQIILHGAGYQEGYVSTPGPLPEDYEGEIPLDGVGNGYGVGWHLQGVGLGRFFVPDAGWLGSQGEESRYARFTRPSLEEAAPSETVLKSIVERGPLFAQGLTSVVPEAIGLNDQQMTALTSPTTGCSPGIPCVPVPVEVSFSEESPVETVTVCAEDEVYKGKAVMVIRTNQWNMTYPAPTHQYGAWNGKQVDDFDGADDGPGLYTGTPPLIKGPQEIRVSSIVIHTGEQGSIWNQFGQIRQVNVDQGDEPVGTYTKESVTKVQGGIFQPC